MNRHSLALVLLLCLPQAALAQKEPPHTRETRDAEKIVASAMTRSAPEQRRALLEQAVAPLRTAMQKDPGNARVWLLAGTVLAGVGELAAADSAFTKAVELHPAYADQVRLERHGAWETTFNSAIQLLNQQKIDEGLAGLEAAEIIFNERPEAQYYLGVLYLQRQQFEKAGQAFAAALAAVNGPLRAELKQEAKDEWDRLAVAARIQSASALGLQGAQLYDRKEYDAAAQVFARAQLINAASRDHLFNRMQSMYAEVLDLDKQRAAGKSAALDQRAHQLYSAVLALSDTLRTVDPRNEDIYFLSSRAHKTLNELAAATDVKLKHAQALRAVNAEYEQVPFFVGDVQMADLDAEAVVTGVVYNKLLKAGATAPISFEVLGLDGKPVGAAVINVTIPADAEERITFKANIPVTGPVAGWRYTVK